jgi:2-polyprenyl-6-methoxyphenol hydroxylase-like FAD-dependent oxidoreductase
MTSKTAGHNDPPVIIVGAGPVGMTATAMLAREGVPVVLIEAEPVPKTDWRASTFHAATLELLEQIEITDQMVAEGLAVPRYQFRDRRDGLVAEFDLTLLREETPYPFRLQLNQQHLVRMLYERLRTDDNVTMFFGSRVSEVAGTSDGAMVLMETPTGPVTLHGSYVIGADGAGSTVRQSLKVDFAGYTHPERFLIASTTADISELVPGIAEVNYVADPREWLFILRTPESWRAVWPVPPEVSREAATRPETLQAQLQGLAPCPGGYPIVDHQIYNVHQRVASTFRVGNVMLVGDAAHINSPMGGVGLNSGIHDAMDLTTRIVRLLAGAADPESELRTFADVRRRVAIEYVQADTKRNTERLAETDDARRRENQAEMRAIAGDPHPAPDWLRRVSLLESVRRFGIGTPPHEYESIRAAAG